MWIRHGSPHVNNPFVIPVQPFNPVYAINHPPDFLLIFKIGEVKPVLVMTISLEWRVTFVPPVHKCLKVLKSILSIHIPLIGRTYQLKFFHNLLFIPWLNSIHYIFLRCTVQSYKSAIENVSVSVFKYRRVRHTPACTHSIV